MEFRPAAGSPPPGHDKIAEAIRSLPKLARNAIPIDDSCPICLIPFADLVSTSLEVQLDHCGVTMLSGCGHIFCMDDLSEWIRSMHGTCPTCRHIFLDIQPPSEDDGESSDGGEYLPDDIDEEDEDGFMDTDGFSDGMTDEFDMDGADVEMIGVLDGDYYSDAEDWLSTEGASTEEETYSEGYRSFVDQDEIGDDANISIVGEETLVEDGVEDEPK